MGSSSSLSPATPPWLPQEWQPLPQPQCHNRTATLRNTRTGALVDEYQLIWDSQHEYQFYLRSFNWRNRRTNCSPIVAAVGMMPLGRGASCGERLAANVYLEHVGLRLSQIEDIPLSDSLYILLSALEGYQQLYFHAGYFRIEEEQIGIDRNGKVRVWISGDFSRNYPETDT
jgi:hypothetical protein